MQSEREDGEFQLALNVRHPKCHAAADAFWKYWQENGETHKHGYYESTWGAINRAICLVGVIPHGYGEPIIQRPSAQVGEGATDHSADASKMIHSAAPEGRPLPTPRTDSLAKQGRVIVGDERLWRLARDLERRAAARAGG